MHEEDRRQDEHPAADVAFGHGDVLGNLERTAVRPSRINANIWRDKLVEMGAKTGRYQHELVALSRNTDPFLTDAPADRRDARWIVPLIAEIGVSLDVHERGLHYSLAGHNAALPSGKLYAGSKRDAEELEHAVNAARNLEGRRLLPLVGIPAALESEPDRSGAALPGVESAADLGSPVEAAPRFDPRLRESGATVLGDVLGFIARHLAASDEVRVVLGVWAAHTHALDVFGTTPYLHVTSAEPESGKSRVLELLDLLCREPIRTSSISLAAVFRGIYELRPTLLIDEADNLFADRSAKAELLGVLNDGYRRGGAVLRVGGRDNRVLERFEVFCPKVLAGLRELPGSALKSRCLRIEVKPRLPGEPGGGFVFEDEQEAGYSLRDRLARWVDGFHDELRGRRPDRIEGMRDRTWESVRPLVALAEAAGEEWPQRLRAALLVLVSAGEDEARSSGVRVLADCWRAFEQAGREGLTKDEMLARLRQVDDAPYAEWENFTTNKLTRMLKRYSVPSDSFVHDQDGRSHRGWKREHFADAWARWTPSLLSNRANRANRANGSPESHIDRERPCGAAASHTFEQAADPHGYAVRTDCTDSAPLPGERGFHDFLNNAYDAGHVTEQERFERRVVHDLILRRPEAT
jgi:hypothetical protein